MKKTKLLTIILSAFCLASCSVSDFFNNLFNKKEPESEIHVTPHQKEEEQPQKEDTNPFEWTEEQKNQFNEHLGGYILPVVPRVLTKFSYFSGGFVIECKSDETIASSYAELLNVDDFTVNFDESDKYYHAKKDLDDIRYVNVTFYDLFGTEDDDGTFQICAELKERHVDTYSWTEAQKQYFDDYLDGVVLPYPSAGSVGISYREFNGENCVYIGSNNENDVLDIYLSDLEELGFTLGKHPLYGIDTAILQLDNHSYLELWVAIADETLGGGGIWFEVIAYHRLGVKIADNKKFIEFGSYPQSEVFRNSTLYATLTTLAGTLPTKTNPLDWSCFDDFYAEYTQQNYGFYKDIVYNNDVYRAYYVLQPRTISASQPDFDVDNPYQMVKNGYNVETLYFFKFEPIIWEVMKTKEGATTLAPTCVLDNMYFCTRDPDTSYIVNGKDIPICNYEYSDIRYWINNNFYNTAFSDIEKSKIQTSEIINSINQCAIVQSEQSTIDMYSDEDDLGPNYYENYLSSDLEDKVFLFSRKELIDLDFGYETVEAWGNDLDMNKTTKPGTDYAFARGALKYSSVDEPLYKNGVNFYLRSPNLADYFGTNAQFSEFMYGLIYKSAHASQCLGVYPGIVVNL